MNARILSDIDYKSEIEVPYGGVVDSCMQESEFDKITEIIKEDPRFKHSLIPGICIRKRTSELAREIHKDFLHLGQLNILMVLTGAFIFASDLGREFYNLFGQTVRYHSIKTSVYDKTIKGTDEHNRAVRLELEPMDIEGKDILVVEDIADQGFTLSWMTNYLQHERKVNSMKICSLLNKLLENPSSTVKELRKKLVVDYIGFNIPDVWIAGYGLDSVGYSCRNIPSIVTIDESYTE